MRTGFAQLTADPAHKVLRPLAEAMVDTTDDAVAPTLAEVRDRFASRLPEAEEAANDALDDAISGDPQRPQVMKVESHLRGREVGGRGELQAVFRELEDRIGPLLDKGARVRIV